MLEQMPHETRIADVRAISPMIGEDLEPMSIGESASEADFINATCLRQSSVNVEDYEFH
jgi:hypothetical protein